MKRIIDAYNWLSIEESASIGPHRMGYTAKHPKHPKLRIIALNTNFWALQNYYNYVNTTSPRDSIILSDLIGWLIQAEKAQERVWIVGHIPPFAGQALPNHSEAFYQVIERFSPHVIAGIFFGHLHIDSVNIFYKAGGKDVTKEDNVAMVSWLGPSLSPKSGHPSYKVYEVDTGDFRVYESRTYYTNSSNLSNSPQYQANAATNNNGQNGSANGLVWELGCDAREAYGKAINWPSKSPLNAAFWHRVGTTMLQGAASNGANLAAIYRMFRSTSIAGKGVTGPCDATCVTATVCRMRAAKESLWEQCGSDEVQKDPKASTTSVSTQSSTTSNGNLSVTAAPTKRSVGPGEDIEIDIYIDDDNKGIDNSADEEPQPNVRKRWGSGFWSKMSSMASAAGKKAQNQGQSSQTSLSGHATYTKTITGTSTKTMTVSPNQGGSSSIAKRTAEPGIDEAHPSPAGLDARSADPEPTGNPDDRKFTENILPAEATSLTNWGYGELSAAMTANQGLTSTGAQLLNQVISAQSQKTSYHIIYPSSASVRARPRRDPSHESQDPMEPDSPDIFEADESPSVSSEGHDQGEQTLAETVQIPDQPLQRRDMTLADAPDTTITASSNSPTDGNSGADSDQPWEYPIYRPEESMNGQILRRRPSVGGEGEAMAVPTQGIFSGMGQAYDPEDSATGFDMVAKRDEKKDPKREPGCSAYSTYSVCSSSATYIEYTPEQSTQILAANAAGASKYNALMKTMFRKTTSKWTTVTMTFTTAKATESAQGPEKRDVSEIPACMENREGVDCESIEKRTAAPEPTAMADPDPKGPNFIDLARKKDAIKSAKSTWTPWTTDSNIEEATWIAPWESGYAGDFKKRTAAPEPTAIAEPEPGNKLFDLWSSRASTEAVSRAASLAISGPGSTLTDINAPTAGAASKRTGDEHEYITALSHKSEGDAASTSGPLSLPTTWLDDY